MTTILLLLAFFPLTVAAGAGERCPGVPSLSVDAACREACGTKLMYDLCMDTLRKNVDPDPSNAVEATVYALLAANRALESYAATAEAISENLLRNASLGGDEREAYRDCGELYVYAEQSMGRVAGDMLPRCWFVGLGDEYVSGLMDLEGCRDRVLRLTASPLYAVVLVDRNRAVLAYFLGKLLGIRA